MSINFGREICGILEQAETREWLVTNGIGGYASGTVASLLTRRYHGLLVAALKPPLGRTLLVAKVDETVQYDGHGYPLGTNRWVGGAIGPNGYRHIERFQLEGTIPVWQFACGDAILEKRIWMQQGANTTYIHYQLSRATQPLTFSIKVFVNYRDYHSDTQADGWEMGIDPVEGGVCVTAFPLAVPLYLLIDSGEVSAVHHWYYGYDLAVERYRGLCDHEDHLHAATFHATLQPGESLTLVASTEKQPNLQSEIALDLRRSYEQKLLERWQERGEGEQGRAGERESGGVGEQFKTAPPEPLRYQNCSSGAASLSKLSDWVAQLVLAADQFIVDRPLENQADGKTVIAGYPWFSDWGRDTMISLPGLTISAGRPELARDILRTFARYVDQGMLPNRFPDAGETPDYNTVDATLWYFEATRAYYAATQDDDLLQELFPILAEIIDWHCRGTRYNIHRDASDGLLYAGEEGSQLTWMDAKVGDWVVTPRIGKPIEVNALWYNALHTMAMFAQKLSQSEQEYQLMAQQAAGGFTRFWNPSAGYCYDVIDSPQGQDASLRPNQIFAVSLPQSPLTAEQQRKVVESCARYLLTSHGLRSLAPDEPQYQGQYGGDQRQRDGAYHQGTVWGWLIGPFVLAHLRVFNDPAEARRLLEPMANHISAAGVGTLSEIFDGDAPMTPRGCIAQAWTVAEVLRAWKATES